MNPCKSTMAALAAAVCFTACGPTVKNLVWPPVANPTMDGLYPYDFDNRGLSSVSALHEKMLSTRIEDKAQDQQLLYALGRAQVDAFMWAMTLTPQHREDVMAELGDILGVKKATSETFLADPGPLVEPLKLLAIRYPKSSLASAGSDVQLVFRLLTHESLPEDQAGRVRELAAGQRPGSPVVRAAVLIIAGQALTEIASLGGAGRSQELVKRLDRFAGGVLEDEDEPMRVERVLEWVAGFVWATSSDPDPVFLELRHVTEAGQWVLGAMLFPAGLPRTVDLPDLAGLPGEAEDPFRYVIIDKDRSIRVATGIVFGVDDAGKVIMMGDDSRWAWPGKDVGQASSLPDAIEEASLSVADLGPIGGSPVWDRGVALAVDPALGVDAIMPVMEVLRASLDHVVLVGRGKQGVTTFVSTDVRPNCAMAGTRLGALMGNGEILVENVTVGAEEEARVSDADTESPLLLAGRVHDQALGVLGKPRTEAFVEVAWIEGSWSWGQLVAVYEGLLSALGERAGEYEMQVAVQTFLLPSMTMGESRELEVMAEMGEDVTELPAVAGTTREQLVLLGAYGNYDENELDAWMSAYLDGMPLEQAATVVLDVARCWGGDYRERAVSALSEGKKSILEQVATYLGDPGMGQVAEAILVQAGSRAVPVLVWKLMSNKEDVWTGAWRVLAKLDPGDIEHALEPLLADADPGIRLRALQLYGNSMPAGEHPELIALLDDPDLTVRRWAMATCGMLGVQGAVDRLMEYASSKTTVSALKAEALYALGLLEAHEALAYMIEAAGHPDPEVRELTALALGSVGVGEPAVAALLGLLGDEEPTVVLNAMRSLVNVGSPDAVTYLEAMLDSPHPGIAAEAQISIDMIEAANEVSVAGMSAETIEAACDSLTVADLPLLAQNPAEEALDCLIELSKSKDPDTRLAACVAMGERGDVAAIPALTKRTKDKIKKVRLAAWAALDILKNKKSP